GVLHGDVEAVRAQLAGRARTRIEDPADFLDRIVDRDDRRGRVARRPRAGPRQRLLLTGAARRIAADTRRVRADDAIAVRERLYRLGDRIGAIGLPCHRLADDARFAGEDAHEPVRRRQRARRKDQQSVRFDVHGGYVGSVALSAGIVGREQREEAGDSDDALPFELHVISPSNWRRRSRIPRWSRRIGSPPEYRPDRAGGPPRRSHKARRCTWPETTMPGCAPA